MKKLAICITLIAAILTGCNGDEKAAQARLDKARAMYENNEFFGAKNEIDSIRALYPKEVKVLKQGLTLMRQVEVKEAERNIAFCDSLLPIKLESRGIEERLRFREGFRLRGNRQLYLETADDRAQRATLLRTLRRERGGRDVSGQRILRRTPHRAYGNQAEPERRPIRRDRFHPVRRRTELPLQGYGSTTEVVTYKGSTASMPSSSSTITRKSGSRWNTQEASLTLYIWRTPTRKRSSTPSTSPPY